MRTIALVLAAVGCAALAGAQEAPPTIVTTGTALVQRSPDVAFISLAVESRARTPREAQQQNASTLAAVVKRLTDLSIPADARRTIGLRLEQEFDNANGRRVPRGYVARNALEVRVDDLARAGELADAAVQAGATSLDGIRFDLKDRAAAEREAVRLAVVDARGRAEAAAAGAGRTVDRVLKIEDGERIVSPPRPIMAMRAEVQSMPTAVEPGLIDIRATMTLTASMK
jgi:uncharacterized protein YggE